MTGKKGVCKNQVAPVTFPLLGQHQLEPTPSAPRLQPCLRSSVLTWPQQHHPSPTYCLQQFCSCCLEELSIEQSASLFSLFKQSSALHVTAFPLGIPLRKTQIKELTSENLVKNLNSLTSVHICMPIFLGFKNISCI